MFTVKLRMSAIPQRSRSDALIRTEISPNVLGAGTSLDSPPPCLRSAESSQ